MRTSGFHDIVQRRIVRRAGEPEEQKRMVYPRTGTKGEQKPGVGRQLSALRQAGEIGSMSTACRANVDMGSPDEGGRHFGRGTAVT